MHYLIFFSQCPLEVSIALIPFLQKEKQVQSGYDLSTATMPNPVSHFSPLLKNISQNPGAQV